MASSYKVNVSEIDGVNLGLREQKDVDVILSDLDYHKGPFGTDALIQDKDVLESTTGTSFVVYDTLTFNVSDLDSINKYRVGIGFVWSYASASQDFELRALLDGVSFPNTFRQEPKSADVNQRNWTYFSTGTSNLANGTHNLSVEYRSLKNNVEARIFRTSLEVWRIE